MPVIIFGALASPPVAAELAWLLEDALRRARRDGWRPSEEARAFVDDLANLAQMHREAEAARRVTPAVAHATVQTSRPGTLTVMMTTHEVAEAQAVTVAAVAARCRRGTVPGAKQSAHGWRIPATYLEGR